VPEGACVSAAPIHEEQVVANRTELMIELLRGFGKLIFRASARAWTLTAAVAADSRGTLNLARSRRREEKDEGNKYRAGPDDMPTDREKRDTPLQFGA
jgi:hypothetical protein